MANVTCAISGIKFTTECFDSLIVPNTDGYIHPIFALDRQKLYPYYRQHCLGKLSDNDSYLLFLAFLHSSERVTWNAPASLVPTEPRTKQLIERNFSQLVSVLEKTDLISHPAFDQPSYKVHSDTSSLGQVTNWIKAWKSNIEYFYNKRASDKELDELQALENKLTYKIYSSEPPEKYARVIADWACKAAGFPTKDAVLWKETIRSCFSITKMFNTPLPLLKEIKDYIECNIPVGSIHFHAISEVIKEGISKHEDYLGGSSLALGYTLLPTLDSVGNKVIPAKELKGNAEVATIAAKAADKRPRRIDYPDDISFLRAKLAYRVASNIALKNSPELPTTTEPKKEVLLVDADEPLPKSYKEPEEPDALEEDYDLDDSDLEGLTITDSLE